VAQQQVQEEALGRHQPLGHPILVGATRTKERERK
jgi:hypothetical protein